MERRLRRGLWFFPRLRRTHHAVAILLRESDEATVRNYHRSSGSQMEVFGLGCGSPGPRRGGPGFDIPADQ